MSSSPASPLDAVVTEVERHVAEAGWDQPPLLFALVDTAELLRQEPHLAQTLGLMAGGGLSLTPVQQEALGDEPLDDQLAAIAWPESVLGCALVHEVVVLPPAAEAELPDDVAAAGPEQVAGWAAGHDQRREVRMAVGVLRDGTRACALRLRADPWERDAATVSAADQILSGPDLAPRLADALLATLT